MPQTDPWAQFPVASGAPAGAAPTSGTIAPLPSPPKSQDPADAAREAREAQRFQWDKEKHDRESADVVGIPSDQMHLTGKDFIAKLPPADAAQVQALAEGRMAFPAGKAASSPYWQQRLAQVAQYDPDFDAVNYNARAKTRADFTSGTSSRNIKALNTAIGHVGQLADQISGTASHGGFPFATTVNAIQNAAERGMGDPGITNYAQTAGAVAGELTQVFRGSGGAEADIQRYLSELDPNASEEQKKAAIANITTLLKSRLDALNDQYVKGMGTTAQPLDVLDPHSKQVLAKYLPGFTPPGSPPVGGAGGDGGPGGGGIGLGEGVDGPPQGEVLVGHYRNEDGTLAPIYGKPGTQLPPGAVPLSADEQHQSQIDAKANEIAGRPGLGDIAKNGLTLGLGDEAAGVGGAAGALLTGRDPIAGYTHERDLARLRLQQARENEGALGTATDLVAGGASLGVGSLMGPTAPRSIASLAKEGGSIGALAGYGNGEGAQGSLVGAGAGALAGGSLGAGGGKISDLLATRAMRPAVPSEAAQSLQAGEKYGLNLSLGDVGGRGAKMVERSLDAQPASAGIMNAPRKALTGQIETAVGHVADDFGAPTSFRGMGEAAQSGANRWMDKFNGVVGKLYDRIPVQGTREAVIDSTRTALANLSNKIGSNPELSDLLANPRFEKYLDALTPRNVTQVNTAGVPFKQVVPQGGKLSWQDLKAFRSDIGEQLGEALFTDGTRKGELRTLYSALSNDMEATARASGPGALRAFQRANNTFAGGQQRIEGAITQLLGNDKGAAPEKAAALIQRLAQEGKAGSDLSRLTEIKRTLRPEEWGQLSNGLIRLLGQPANAEGRAFNPQTFIRNFDTMAPEAKNMLFGSDGKALRHGLEEFANVLRKVAENDSTRNTSGSAYGLGSMATSGVGATVGAAAGGSMGALLGMMTGHAATASAAKLWTNPVFVRWATGYAKLAAQPGNTAALAQQVGKLARIAETQGGIAMDAKAMQDYLTRALGQSPTRAAAGDQEQDGRRVPPN